MSRGAKAPWSWGRTYNLLHSFGRAQDRIPPPTRETGHRRIKIETQSGRIGNEIDKRTPMNDHIDARAGARKKIGLDLKLLRREKETRFEGCELKNEKEFVERQER